MQIYFIRHGEPNYEKDCLTETGKKQAMAVANCLKDLGIEKVFSSSNGRALETASYTAKLLGLDVVPCDFMRELDWSSIDAKPHSIHVSPWDNADILASKGISLSKGAWQEIEPFNRSKLVDSVAKTVDGFDDLLFTFGYKREGEYYRVTKKEEVKSIAIFSHGGSSSAVLSHLTNVSFIHFCGNFQLHFTSISVISLANNVGSLVCPKVEGLNDHKHIFGI